MFRFKLPIAIAASLLLGALIGGAAVYYATFGSTTLNPATNSLVEEVAKWRRSSIEFETALLRHTVINAEYEPTKQYMTERIAVGERFLNDEISFDEFSKITNEMDEHARNTFIIHVVGGEDFGYRMQ